MKMSKANPQLLDLIRSLRRASARNRAPVWLAISHALSKPRRKMAEINLSRISRLTEEGETVAVPGKVLGAGGVDHKVTIAALAFTASAREKVRLAGGACITLSQLLDENPKGTRVKIMR
ncbi:50S ribosomal protein L18e [Candidatus Bathyarchaeota archaeon]|nr:50S ribosomal protein L18e [Candidatus Bathyarchaeota archaeon]